MTKAEREIYLKERLEEMQVYERQLRGKDAVLLSALTKWDADR